MRKIVKINGGHWAWNITEGVSSYDNKIIDFVDLSEFEKNRRIILKDNENKEITFIILRCKSDTVEVDYIKEDK